MAVGLFLSNEDFILCQNPRERGEPAEVDIYAEKPNAPSTAPMSRSAALWTNFSSVICTDSVYHRGGSFGRLRGSMCGDI